MFIGDKKENYMLEGFVFFMVDEVIVFFKVSINYVGGIVLLYFVVFGVLFQVIDEEIN